MEAAIRSTIVNMVGDYVYGLDKADFSQFPLEFRNLKLNPKTVSESLQEDTPFSLTSGTVGYVKVDPGWGGSIGVEISGIKLDLGFSAMRAAQLAMRPSSPDGSYSGGNDIFLTGREAPKIDVPPRFCEKHDSSEKRAKRDPYPATCKKCGMTCTTTYAEFTLCSSCSAESKRCLICGAGADKAGTYIPAASENEAKKAHGQQKPPPGGNRGSSFGGAGNPSGPSSMKQNMPRKDANNGSMFGNDNSVFQAYPAAGTGPPQQQQQRGAPNPNTRGLNRGPPQAQRRPQQDDDDDDPITALLRVFNCNALGLDDESTEYADNRETTGRHK